MTIIYGLYRADGAQACLTKFGLDEEASNTPGLVAAGLAAPTPFLGMIGQKPIIHDPSTNPNIKLYNNVRDIEQHVRPGDVMITGKPEFSLWKHLSSPFSGTPLYHAEAVGHPRKGMPTHIGVEEFNSGRWENKSIEELMRRSPRMRNMARGHYPDFVVLRPKGIQGKEDDVVRDLTARSKKKYDLDTAIKAWAHDIFVPKGKASQKIAPEVTCEGNVCSTMPSMALKSKANIDVVPGTPASLTLPADFLRSSEFEPVGAVGKFHTPSKFNQKVLPLLSRGALGLGLAGTAYEATEHPDIAAGAAGYALSNQLMRKSGPIDVMAPRGADFGHTDIPAHFMLGEHLNPRGRKALLHFAGKRLLPNLLAGAGAYTLANKLMHSDGNAK